MTFQLLGSRTCWAVRSSAVVSGPEPEAKEKNRMAYQCVGGKFEVHWPTLALMFYWPMIQVRLGVFLIFASISLYFYHIYPHLSIFIYPYLSISC